MLILITGTSGAANPNMRKKSAVDLRAVQKYYIATMQPYGAEGAQRIRRHHALRQEKALKR